MKINYGLIVVDPTQEGDMLDIIHFVGYENEPSAETAMQLREELSTDEEFGLIEIIDNLLILPAPEDIVEIFRKDIDEYLKQAD